MPFSRWAHINATLTDSGFPKCRRVFIYRSTLMALVCGRVLLSFPRLLIIWPELCREPEYCCIVKPQHDCILATPSVLRETTQLLRYIMLIHSRSILFSAKLCDCSPSSRTTWRNFSATLYADFSVGDASRPCVLLQQCYATPETMTIPYALMFWYWE